MQDHIAFALTLQGTELDADHSIAEALQDDAPAWLHLQANHPETDPWIDRHLDWLNPAVRDALTEAQTRPRTLKLGQGLLVILRGINLNVGEDPEDMVSLRLYIDSGRIVSLSQRPLTVVQELADEVRGGNGPDHAGAFLARLVERLTDRIETQADDLEQRVEALEAATIAEPRSEALRPEVADQRLELTGLRRFMGPQRVAVQGILHAGPDWLGETDQALLGEQLDQLTRVSESLDALREQLATIRDEIEGARADRLNRNLYVLSVISAVFLPLGFLTGLMGINLAGMPGDSWPPAFWIFTLALIGISAGVLIALRWAKIL